MEILGPATEMDMVLEFVQADRDSPQHGARVAAAAERLQTDDPVQLLAAFAASLHCSLCALFSLRHSDAGGISTANQL
jgi:hypothetical protein